MDFETLGIVGVAATGVDQIKQQLTKGGDI